MENMTCSHEDQKELASKDKEKKNAVGQGNEWVGGNLKFDYLPFEFLAQSVLKRILIMEIIIFNLCEQSLSIYYTTF